MYGSTALKSPTGEPIFPPELRKRAFSELALPGPLAAWYRWGLPPQDVTWPLSPLKWHTPSNKITSKK